MNDLNRKLILISTSALALTASTGFLVQTEAYSKLKLKYNSLTKENQVNKINLEEQAKTIYQLGEVIKVKNDSITILNLKIDELVAETIQLKGKIKSLDQKVHQMSEKVNDLTKQIGTLEKSNKSFTARISTLENERSELLKKIESLDKKRTQEKLQLEEKKEKAEEHNRARKQLESELEGNKKQRQLLNVSPQTVVDEPVIAAPPAPVNPGIEDEKERIIASRKQMRMREIVMATNIDFNSISVREEKGGKDLDKLKGGEWRYTIINFDLINPKPDAIIKEEFILQVFDTDNQRVVPFNESNPGFPDSNIGATGYKFTYEGNPVEIAYFNSQQKNSKNYEVRLYYAGKGFLLPIKNGTTRIIEQGQVKQF